MIKTLEELKPDINNKRIYNSYLCEEFYLQYDKTNDEFSLLIEHEYDNIHLNPDVTLEWLVEFVNVLNKIEGYNIKLEEIKSKWF